MINANNKRVHCLTKIKKVGIIYINEKVGCRHLSVFVIR